MSASRPSEQLERALESLRDCVGNPPRVGVVLGSGLGEFADTVAGRQAIPYACIEGMVPAAVEGHAGNLVLGLHGRMPIAVMQGRLHLYEGHTPERVVFGVRLMVALGAKVIVLTNAAGGIRQDLAPGSLMLIDDHINLTGKNPLLGPNDPALGTRFPDMSATYDRALCQRVEAAAQSTGVALARGVYAGVLGPSYETPAEVRMLATLGADAVGMSTVHEAIAARHMGARCLGLSCITNRAAGLDSAPLDHADVQRTASETRARFIGLLDELLRGLAQDEL